MLRGKQNIIFDTGSFRDPAGSVFYFRDEVYRELSKTAENNFRKLMSTGTYDCLLEAGVLNPAELVLSDKTKNLFGICSNAVLKHKKIDHISYAYEWPFRMLKKAALAHLDTHLLCLENNFTIVDGNSFNIQFDGVEPKFIDTPSIIPYEPGTPWLGYAQFCEQFLAPLLMSSDLGVPYHHWLRGAPNGMSLDDFSKLLPWRKYFNFNRFIHIILHNRMQKRFASSAEDIKKEKIIFKEMKKGSLINFIKSIRNLVLSLETSPKQKTEWEDYESLCHYSDVDRHKKDGFVKNFVVESKPKCLWDLGCNSGEYAELAIKSGTTSVIGFDVDLGALDLAVKRASLKSLKFLPLYSDALNPSPNQGWAERERKGIQERSSADAVIALAIIHHLVISGGVPLNEVVRWLVERAPTGVIEFVSKKDPMVKKLLFSRLDHFEDYNETAFEKYLSHHAKVVDKMTIYGGKRVLFRFERQ